MHSKQCPLCTDMLQAGSCNSAIPCVWPEKVQPVLQAKDAELDALRARLGQVEGLQAAEDQLASMASKAAELKVGQPAQSCWTPMQVVQNLLAAVACRAAKLRAGANAWTS